MKSTTRQKGIGFAAALLLAFGTSARSSVETMAIPRTGLLTLCASRQPVEPCPAAATRMTASWYGKKFQGRKTASGERFDLNKLTAASKTLPLGSLVRLTATETGRSVVVRINDRGPWRKGRDFDLSEAAAAKLGIHEEGVATVEIALLK